MVGNGYILHCCLTFRLKCHLWAKFTTHLWAIKINLELGLVDWQAAKIREGENFTKKHQGEINQEKVWVIDQRIMAQFKAPPTKD